MSPPPKTGAFVFSYFRGWHGCYKVETDTEPPLTMPMQIPASVRHELETLIGDIEFLDQQLKRVEASLTGHETELAEQEQKLGQMISIAHMRLERMRMKRENKVAILSGRLKSLHLSFVHNGKVYVPSEGTVVVMSIQADSDVEPDTL